MTAYVLLITVLGNVYAIDHALTLDDCFAEWNAIPAAFMPTCKMESDK